MPIRNSCVVGVLILNEKDEILLQRRGDDNTWSIPGGGMELGESTLETARREIFEETGLEISELELFNVYSGASQYHKYPDGNEFYFINVVYFTKSYAGVLKIDNVETLELKFFNLQDVPLTLAKTNAPIIFDLRQRIFNTL